jgi:FkbM family methyltransferase
MKLENKIKRILYRRLSLEGYLRAVSSLYFLLYRLGFRRLFPMYEYPVFLKKRIARGDVVVDIGANLGYYSWFFARAVGRGGRVYAVEPMQPILPVLRRNVGRYRQVEILPCALGDEQKTIRMVNDTAAADYLHTGHNRVGDQPDTASGFSFEAEMQRGSELFGALERLDWIKCDIEGYEWVVLREMEPVIRRHRPVVLVETWGEQRKQLISFFADLGYSAFVLNKNTLCPAETNMFRDVFFIPEQRMERFSQQSPSARRADQPHSGSV